MKSRVSLKIPRDFMAWKSKQIIMIIFYSATPEQNNNLFIIRNTML